VRLSGCRNFWRGNAAAGDLGPAHRQTWGGLPASLIGGSLDPGKGSQYSRLVAFARLHWGNASWLEDDISKETSGIGACVNEL
jgi:hypothetical protein